MTRGGPALDVCLCTHAPRRDVLDVVLRSVAAQGAARGAFDLLLVDNATAPPLGPELLAPLRAAGRAAALTREETPGLTRARLHAIRRTQAPWMLFIDDDSVLDPSYVQRGLAFVEAHPEVGCFGGRILLPGAMRAPRWARAYLPYLAIKDEGDELITGTGSAWGPWEPPGAGMWIRRDVLEAYRRRLEDDPRALRLGRRGRRGLGSCEDSLLSREAGRLGLLTAYVPGLVLYHHVAPSRLRLGYLLRLMRSYGESHVLLEALLAEEGRPPEVPGYYRDPRAFRGVLRDAVRQGRRHSLRFALGLVLYHRARRRAYQELSDPGAWRLPQALAGAGSPASGGLEVKA